MLSIKKKPAQQWKKPRKPRRTHRSEQKVNGRLSGSDRPVKLQVKRGSGRRRRIQRHGLMHTFKGFHVSVFMRAADFHGPDRSINGGA